MKKAFFEDSAMAMAKLIVESIYHGILTLSMVEIFHSLNMRSRRGSLFKMTTHNHFLFGAMVVSLILTTAVIEVPFLAAAFEFTPIDLNEYAVALGLAVLIIPIMEIVKFFQRKLGK